MFDTFGNEIEAGDFIIYIDGRYGYINSYLSQGLVTKVNEKSIWVLTEKIAWDGSASIKKIKVVPPNPESHFVVVDESALESFGLLDLYGRLREEFHGA